MAITVVMMRMIKYVILLFDYKFDFGTLIPVNNHVSQKYDDRSEGQIESKIGIKNYIID